MGFPSQVWHGGLRGLTAPNATDSIVCILASSMELSTPFLLSKARPANVQKRTCLIPTDTKWVSESGRNSATKILWVWPIRPATLAPEKPSRAAKATSSRWGKPVSGKCGLWMFISCLPATSRWWRCVRDPGLLIAGVFPWHWSWPSRRRPSGSSAAPTASALSWRPTHEWMERLL